MGRTSSISGNGGRPPSWENADTSVSGNAVNSWSRRKVESRRKLLAAARKLFAEGGYHKIRTQDISREAGVGYGTFYLQFEDKLDCFRSVIDAASEELRDAISSRLASAVTFADQIRAILDASFDYSLAHPGLLRLMLADTRILSNEGPQSAPSLDPALAALAARWQRDGAITQSMDARLLWFIIRSAVRQGDIVIRNDPANKPAIAEGVTAFLVRGLEAARSGAYDASMRDVVRSVPSRIETEAALSPKPLDSRGKLLVAARKLFVEQGYDAVKPREITELAGVGVGTFYSYFEDKLDCFVAVANDAADELQRIGKRYVEPAVNFADRLRLLLRASFDYSEANPGLYRAIIADVRVFAKNNKRPAKRGLDTLMLDIETYKASGDIDDSIDDRAIAFMLAGIVSEGDAFILQHPERREEIIESVTRFIYNAVSKL